MRLHGIGSICTFKNFTQDAVESLVSFLIKSFEILHSNTIFVSSLISFFEMSTKIFQFYHVSCYMWQFGSAPIRLQETSFRSGANRITFESDPVWVRMADPNGCGSLGSTLGPPWIHLGSTLGPVQMQTLSLTTWVQIHLDPISCKWNL